METSYDNNILDIDCAETCPFCGLQITRVREYVVHLEDCQSKKKQEADGTLSFEQSSSAIQRRKTLTQAASVKLNQELSAKKHSNGGDSSESGTDAGRGATRQPKVPSKTSGPRKRRIMKHGFGVDGDVVATSHPVTEDSVMYPGS